MERTEASETLKSAMRGMQLHFEVDSKTARLDSLRNLDFAINRCLFVYCEPDDYPISRSILLGQITADGMIIGFRTKQSMTTDQNARQAPSFRAGKDSAVVAATQCCDHYETRSRKQ